MPVEKMKIALQSFGLEDEGLITRISGFIGHSEVVALAPVMGTWGVSTSTCLFGGLEQSREQAKCLVAVFEEFDRLELEGRIYKKPEPSPATGTQP